MSLRISNFVKAAYSLMQFYPVTEALSRRPRKSPSTQQMQVQMTHRLPAI